MSARADGDWLCVCYYKLIFGEGTCREPVLLHQQNTGVVGKDSQGALDPDSFVQEMSNFSLKREVKGMRWWAVVSYR